ncbi:hypothetical protein Cni_G22640 [Canna indica]|uniref:Uncharacterized protein n=1 Tax=Canna indica TaxID=4628 RepID=A0AAQ3QMU5_9LILI|nr:hypothetical protein Cni_G22640 [Canna indica]
MKRAFVLIRLRRAIQKVRFLLSFNASNWLVSSFSSSFSGGGGCRAIGVELRQGLLDSSVSGATAEFYDVGSSFAVSRTTSSASDLSRTVSGESSSQGEDVNVMADRFIENFKHHLQMERQVSLELYYCRERILERTISDF